MENKRTIVYIDGFNLYNGIVSKGLDKYKWLDLFSLCKKIMGNEYSIELVRYFTSRIKGNQNKYLRQSKYILALETFINKQITVEYGRFQLFDSECKICGASPILCSSCSNPVNKPNEKKTDVNLATCMLTDCFENNADCLMLISGDSDYEETLLSIKRLFPLKERIIAFPPKRRNPRLYDYCDIHLDITPVLIRNSQLPNPVINPKNGNKYYKPLSWE